MLFQWHFYSCRVLAYDKIEKDNGCERSKCHDLLVLVFSLPPERWFLKISPSDHEPWSIWCNVRVHIDFYIHHAFTCSIGPSSVVWNELGQAPSFPPMRVLEVYWSRACSLVCEVALSYGWTIKFENDRSKFKTLGNLLIVLEESMEYISNQ
jgi:hypothetical protein